MPQGQSCDRASQAAEFKHLHGAFAMNEYPKHLTGRTLKQKLRTKQPAQEENEETPDEERKKRLLIPYMKGVSEKIECICHPLGGKVICRSQHTLRQTQMKVRPDDQKKGVVFEGAYADCKYMYVGETGQSLEMRLQEHWYAVKRAWG